MTDFAKAQGAWDAREPEENPWEELTVDELRAVVDDEPDWEEQSPALARLEGRRWQRAVDELRRRTGS
jgi:hypothetical protein